MRLWIKSTNNNIMSFFLKKEGRGHSLTGKTSILHIVISGSSPDVSMIALAR